MSPDLSRAIESPFKILLVGACLFPFCLLGQMLLHGEAEPLWYFDKQGVFRIADLATYFALTKAFWAGEIERFYLPDLYQPIFSKLARAPVTGTMPLAVLPSALLLWAPFVFFSQADFYYGYLCWNALGLSLFFSSILLGLQACQSFRQRRALLLSSFIFLMSSTFLLSLVLGQTSPFALGLFNILFLRVHYTSESRSIWLEVIILLLLSIKTHYLICASILILGYQEYRLFTYFAGVLLSLLAVLTLKLGASWPADYASSMSYFLSQTKPAAMASSFGLDSMTVFTAATKGYLSPRLASLVSSIALVGALTVGASNLRLVRKNSSKLKGMLPMLPILTGYLLFSPYVGSYENLLVFLPLFVFCLEVSKSNYTTLICLLFSATVFLNYPLIQSVVPLGLVFLLKALFLISLYLSISREAKPSALK